MTATLQQTTTPLPCLYMAFELGLNEWKLAFATQLAGTPRLRACRAADLRTLQKEIAKAKARFGLPQDAQLRTCYEAGRDGFWLHRALADQGIDNLVVDAASIEVNRRARRAKSDRLDAAKLVTMLIRHHQGEKVWSLLRIPTPQEEDQRQLHRNLLQLKRERTAHINRIKGLLIAVGISVTKITAGFVQELEDLRTWEDKSIEAGLKKTLQLEFERLQLVQRQIWRLDDQRNRQIRKGDSQAIDMVRKLMSLQGIGSHSAWVFVMEFFGWRKFRNRKELASLAGLTPTPYDSGSSRREQGISKAGNRRMRTMLVEIAWCWLRWQPESALSVWYKQRFAEGSSRQRRIGIVALARKLLVRLWRYLEFEEVPQGAKLVDWQAKVEGRAAQAVEGSQQKD